MAKKKSTLGKLIALTTTVAAVGGACYIFRDKIKESEIYKTSKDKLAELRNKMSGKFASEEDDFFFDDDFEDDFEDDVFSEDAKNNREYTSITINSKEEADDNNSITEDITEAVEDVTNTASDFVKETTDVVSDKVDDTKEIITEKANDVKEDMKEIFADVSIPTISFGSSTSDEKDETSATEEVLGYENEGLSDVYEDPDVLEEQDKLDF